MLGANLGGVPKRALIPAALRVLPFRGSEAIRRGLLTRHQLHGRAWRRLFPDIYISSRMEMTHRRWCEAALLYAGSDAVIAGRSAAYVMGVDLLSAADEPVTVVVPAAQRPRPHPHVVIIHTDLADSDILRWRIPMTTPQRTAFDLARLLDFEDAVIALDALTHRKLVTLNEIRSYALVSRSLPGRRRVARVLAEVEPLAASPMETRLRLRVVGGGLPRPEAQIEVMDEYGRFVGRVDMGYRAYRVGLEYEGDHHRQRPVFRKDIRRGNALQEAGWTIIRVTADDIREPSVLLRQLRKLLGEENSAQQP